MQGSTLSLNFPVYWVEIFQNVIQNLLSQKYVILLHLFPPMNVKTKLDSKIFKRKNLVLICWNFLVLCTNVQGNAQFDQKGTFKPLMDFKQNLYGNWKCYKSCYFEKL